MFRSSRVAWGLAATLACVAATALPAAAQERLEVSDEDELQCVAMESCTPPTSSCPNGTSCQTLPSDLLRCSAGETGARCCTNTQDCTALLGSDGACDIEVIGSDGDQTICSSPDGVTAERYCSDTAEVDMAQFEQCHTTPAGAWTADWLEGDCDADGSPNGEDSAPCSDAIVGGRDAGTDAGADGGATDAGTGMDAGARPADDAGSTARDAAVEDAAVDASTDGAVSMDAGGKDAAAGTGGNGGMGGAGGGGAEGGGGMMVGGSGGAAGARADAATGSGGLTFRGRGGCSCHVPGGERPGAWVMFSFLGLAWLRWRRRAR